MPTDNDELVVRLRHTAADMVGNYDGEHDDWAELIREAADRIEAADKRIEALIAAGETLFAELDCLCDILPQWSEYEGDHEAIRAVLTEWRAALQQKERDDGPEPGSNEWLRQSPNFHPGDIA